MKMNILERVTIAIWCIVGVAGASGVYDESPRFIIVALSCYAAFSAEFMRQGRELEETCKDSQKIARDAVETIGTIRKEALEIIAGLVKKLNEKGNE